MTKKSKNKRQSLLIHIGRIYQNISPLFAPFDSLFEKLLRVKKEDKKDCPVVVLLAPPRSGSTLTYQILTSGIKNFHLTNIWNLLFSTPVLGGLVSSKLCKNYKSSFHSFQGFVPGLCGEAEGLKFWNYWSGQNLEEQDQLNIPQLQKLAKKINLLGNGDRGVFITGYLGHVFSVEALREVFPKIIFVHLYRDLLSNSHSIYQLSSDSWTSTKPKGFSESAINNLSRHEVIAKQVTVIHSKVIAQGKKNDIISVSYEEICKNPNQVIDKIVAFANSRDILLDKNKLINIPNSFAVSKVNGDLNENTKKLEHFLSEELEANHSLKEFFYENNKI